MQLKERVCRREMEGGHWSLKLDFLLPLPALALWNRLSSFAGWCVVSADSPQCGEHDCDEPTSNWSFSRELLSCQATRKGCKQRPASFDFFFFQFQSDKIVISRMLATRAGRWRWNPNDYVTGSARKWKSRHVKWPFEESEITGVASFRLLSNQSFDT